jgi:hypothetical protein
MLRLFSDDEGGQQGQGYIEDVMMHFQVIDSVGVAEK